MYSNKARDVNLKVSSIKTDINDSKLLVKQILDDDQIVKKFNQKRKQNDMSIIVKIKNNQSNLYVGEIICRILAYVLGSVIEKVKLMNKKDVSFACC